MLSRMRSEIRNSTLYVAVASDKLRALTSIAGRHVHLYDRPGSADCRNHIQSGSALVDETAHGIHLVFFGFPMAHPVLRSKTSEGRARPTRSRRPAGAATRRGPCRAWSSACGRCCRKKMDFEKMKRERGNNHFPSRPSTCHAEEQALPCRLPHPHQQEGL